MVLSAKGGVVTISHSLSRSPGEEHAGVTMIVGGVTGFGKIPERKTDDVRLSRDEFEPAGGQGAWHHHVHAFPRYDGDELDASWPYPQFVRPGQREPCAERLRRCFATESNPLFGRDFANGDFYMHIACRSHH
jgi:hypothetical protein